MSSPIVTRFGGTDTGMIRIERSQTFNGPWSRCQTRKPFACKLTGVDYPAGTMAYRPVSNGNQRMDRIAAVWIDGGKTE